MSDPVDSFDEPSDAELADLTALLTRAEPWGEPPRQLEDRVVAAIAATAGADTSGEPVSLADHRSRRTWSPSRLLGAAAAIAVILAGVVVIARGGGDDSVAFALEGTDAAPEASATVQVFAAPAGLRILLEADGLPGAPEGYMYEAWVGNGTVIVSAGTFHLRGESGSIELWAGVTEPSYRHLLITLEPIDDDMDSSGDVRLRGDYDLTGG